MGSGSVVLEKVGSWSLATDVAGHGGEVAWVVAGRSWVMEVVDDGGRG